VRRVLAATGLFVALLASSAHAAVPVRFERLDGFRAPGTPARLNKVGVLQIGPRSARNVLVLNPGTSAGAAYFAPVAKDLVERADGWQVWAVERRENLLEDHSMLDRARQGTATGPPALRLSPAAADDRRGRGGGREAQRRPEGARRAGDARR
jgi:hypothetical protein